MANKRPLFVKYDSTPKLGESLNIFRHESFRGVITKMSSDLLKREFVNEEIGQNQECFSRCPLSFQSVTFNNEIIALIEVNQLLDSTNEEVRRNYEEKVLCDIQFALHLRPQGPVYIKPSCSADKLGKLLMKSLPNAPQIPSLVVEIDLVSKEYIQRMHFSDENEDDDLPDSWHYWNEIHAATNYSTRLEVALVLSSDIPFEDPKMIARWLGESVMMIVVPHTSFITNSNNYPVFSQLHQKIFKLLLGNLRWDNFWMVFEPKKIEDTNLSHYKDYLGFLDKMITNINIYTSEEDEFRYPLQPLRDDLDFETYEVFERDKAKYTQYQKAIETAIIDKVPESEKDEKKLVVVIVGAGRGPLVRAALNASVVTKRKVKIIIVEKNRNAINTLRALVRDLWVGKGIEIEIIAKDMRKIELSEKADILVSELLGSFGDNELSPECLDCAQHLLKEDGISIPCNSISYLRPVMAKRLTYNISKHMTRSNTVLYNHRFEYSWLSYLKSVFYIDDPKEAIKFVHPNKEVPIDNSRHVNLEFTSSVDCVLHGFCGYFSSQLYKDVAISILPSTHTQGMVSWYSIFFPIPETVNLKKGDRIELSFSRKCDDTKVWYEYQLQSPLQTRVVNKDGKICPILL